MVLVATAGAAASFTLWLFWPGYMSWDSADQWRQALSGEFTDIAPPLMGMIWRAIGTLVPGPGGMLLLQTVLWWSCIALAVGMTQQGRLLRAVLLLLLLGFWPALWGVLPHVWKDVWMALAFAGAVLALTRDTRKPSRWLRTTALLLLVAGCAFRHNAVFGAFPIAALIAARELRSVARRPRWSGRHPNAGVALLALSLTVLTVLLAGLPTRLCGARRVHDQWAVVSIWDMAAISLREEKVLMPPVLIDRPFTLDELRGHFTDYSNTTLFDGDLFRHPFLGPLTAEERDAAYLGWLQLAARHPSSYLAHRARLSVLLFGFTPSSLPDYLVLSPGLVHLDGNPPLAPRRPPLQATVQCWLGALVDGPLFAGWLYALFALALVVFGYRRRANHEHDLLSAVIAMSGLSYALPLTLTSGGADFRYLFWLILATALGALLAFSSRASRNARPAECDHG